MGKANGNKLMIIWAERSYYNAIVTLPRYRSFCFTWQMQWKRDFYLKKHLPCLMLRNSEINFYIHLTKRIS